MSNAVKHSTRKVIRKHKEAYKFQFNRNIVVTLSDERLITPSGLCMVGQIFVYSNYKGLH